MKIVIAPYGQKLRNGKTSAKQYPVDYWEVLVFWLQREGHEVIQVGVEGEKRLVEDCRFNRPMSELKSLLAECDLWISVDSFLPHLAQHVGKRGVVLWGRSDPLIFGYPDNVNLLKDRSYLRHDQFNIWEQCDFDLNAFVEPEVVMRAVEGLV